MRYIHLTTPEVVNFIALGIIKSVRPNRMGRMEFENGFYHEGVGANLMLRDRNLPKQEAREWEGIIALHRRGMPLPDLKAAAYKFVDDNWYVVREYRGAGIKYDVFEGSFEDVKKWTNSHLTWRHGWWESKDPRDINGDGHPFDYHVCHWRTRENMDHWFM